LIVFDGIVLCVCLIDGLRFVLGGFSFGSAARVVLEGALEGKSVWLGIAVLAFFVIALPTVAALLAALGSPLERWPRFLRGQGKSILAFHILLSTLIALLTMTDVSMEVLSGWTKGKTVSYSFVSIWLGAVLISKPVYIFYISPIIRKFLVRVVPGHTPKITEVMEEVVTEERIGGEH